MIKRFLAIPASLFLSAPLLHAAVAATAPAVEKASAPTTVRAPIVMEPAQPKSWSSWATAAFTGDNTEKSAATRPAATNGKAKARTTTQPALSPEAAAELATKLNALLP